MTDKVDVDGLNRSITRDAESEYAVDREIQPHQEEISNLYQEYYMPLVATLRKMYGNGPPDPEDVANEAFERIVTRGDVGSIDKM